MKKLLPIVLTSLLSAFFAILIYTWFFQRDTVIIEQEVPSKYTNFAETSTGEKYVVAAPSDFVVAANKVTSSVVHIKSLTKSYDWWGGANYASSSGSGVIISPDGYITTNNHVVEGASELEVSLNDKRTFPAKLIGTDPTTDLALLKIDQKNLPTLKFADSDKSRIGEWVLAVGNPFSLTSTVTAGIISAKGRNIEILEDTYAIESFIQTDAAVNPGNSGGALVNTNGDLVGINTAIITKSGRYEGYSFAVPANLVKKVVADLKEFGKVQRGLLNVRIEDVNGTMVEELGLPSMEGVYVRMVIPGGAAEEAKMKAGDVIVGINGKKIKSIPELQEIIGRYRPGDEISLDFLREGRKMDTNVILKDKFGSTSLANNNSSDPELKKLGIELRNLTSSELSRIKTKGVKVVSILRNSKIDRTNMEPGYIITKVNEKEIKTLDDFISILKDIRKGKKVMLEGFYEDYPDDYFYAFSR